MKLNLGTKNLSPKELFSNRLWFSGPQFLILPRNCWPDLHVRENFSNYNIDNSIINLVDGESLILQSSCTQSNVNNLNLVAKEELLENKSTCLITTFDKIFGVSPVIDIANYSSSMKSLCVTGWVIKFIKKLKSLKNSNYMYKPYITLCINFISPVLISMKQKYYGFEMYKRIFYHSLIIKIYSISWVYIMMIGNCCIVEGGLKMLIFHMNPSIQLFHQKIMDLQI